MNREQAIQAIDKIRVWQKGDKRAPHKPLLVLLALARFLQGQPEPVAFTEIEPQLKELLDEFGPANSSDSRHYPFWHLHTDGDGAIWQLSGPERILSRPPRATPSLTELREHKIEGGFSPGLRAAFEEDVSLVPDIANRLLHAHFPETMRQAVLDAVGLDIAFLPAVGVMEDRPDQARDSKFRSRVLMAYEYRCCVCNHDLRLGRAHVGLEAAHIKWVQAGGPNVGPNGLALCSLHHTLFDYGAFTILPDSYQVAYSQQAIAGESTKANLLAHHGQSIRNPQSRSDRPDGQYLQWHYREVFKRPEREFE